MRTSFSALAVILALASCKKQEPAPAPVSTPVRPAAAPSAAPVATAGAGEARSIALKVTSDGFMPDSIPLKANQPVKFVVTRTTDETCATDLLIDGTDVKVALPLNTPVEIAWTPTKAGKVKFGCAMDMMVSGVLLVE
jgi:plastocyanin domain-containing protein